MTTTTTIRLASLAIAALLVSTSMASALDRFVTTGGSSYNGPIINVGSGSSHSGPIIDVTPYDPTPIDLPFDPTPIDLDTYDGPIIDMTPDGYTGPFIDLGIEQGQKQGRQAGRGMQLAFACTVGASENLVVSNKGDAVPAGTKFKWEVRSVGERGYFRLKSALSTGEQIRVDVGGGFDAGTPCAAKAI